MTYVDTYCGCHHTKVAPPMTAKKPAACLHTGEIAILHERIRALEAQVKKAEAAEVEALSRLAEALERWPAMLARVKGALAALDEPWQDGERSSYEDEAAAWERRASRARAALRRE